MECLCDYCPILKNKPGLFFNVCDKVGVKFSYGHYCSDAYADIIDNTIRKQRKSRRTGRGFRLHSEAFNRRRMIEIVTRSYIPYAGYVEHEWVDDKFIPTGKYVKHVKSFARKKKKLKKQTSKRVRKSELPNKGNHYRKVSQYEYELF